MNRERKIKVWYPDEKRMAGPFSPNEWCRRLPSNVEQVGVILDFIGRYDKSVNPIYEGDIVEMWCPSRENTRVTDVRFVNGGFTVEANGWFAGGECDITTVGWAMEEDIQFEVIGNIYQNPELLATEGEKA